MQRRGLWAAGVVLLVVGVVAVLAVGTGFAKDEDAGAKCSEATLDGMYLFALDGFGIEENNQLPFAVAGYRVYDGNGKVRGVASANFNGHIIVRKQPFSGTYTVKADCTGTLTLRDGLQNDLFIAPDGSMFTFVQTKPPRGAPEGVSSGYELRGTAKRVGD
jgi:hypothetical protein